MSAKRSKLTDQQAIAIAASIVALGYVSLRAVACVIGMREAKKALAVKASKAENDHVFRLIKERGS